ncbi:uncharacterized protein RMCB_5634 [Mycolicibacterium brisbanense]|uniref:Uncharacterized protein n=1 Tax=Mycolicibacterium brisbanense TaxID=146020 RepID=A0A100W4N0_9MYCO|nr:uncharacterized protein RMCB_5634 [Mycolicibacterium brisbanense]
MGKLIEFAFDDTKPPDTQLRAMRDALDRAGLKPPAEVVLSQGQTKPYEEVFDSIGGVAPGDPVGSPSQTPVSSSTADVSPLPAPVGTGAESAVAEDDLDGRTREYAEREYREYEEAVTRDAPVRSARREEMSRQSQPQPGSGPPHITGELAFKIAADLAREQRALESPHKRYPRPY